jgi:hypothetical protein
MPHPSFPTCVSRTPSAPDRSGRVQDFFLKRDLVAVAKAPDGAHGDLKLLLALELVPDLLERQVGLLCNAYTTFSPMISGDRAPANAPSRPGDIFVPLAKKMLVHVSASTVNLTPISVSFFARPSRMRILSDRRLRDALE